MEKLGQISQIHISPDELSLVHNILSRHIPNVKVEAFGSRVNGNNKQFSDLDLLIHLDPRIDLEKFATLREAFDESDLPFKIDLQSSHDFDNKSSKVQLQ